MGLFKSNISKAKQIVEKIKIYSEVIKDIPKYVAKIEKNYEDQAKDIPMRNILSVEVEKEKSRLSRDFSDIEQTKLKVSYTVIFLLCFTLFGYNLIQNGNYIINFFGLLLLSSSLIGSIGLIWQSIAGNKKMVE